MNYCTHCGSSEEEGHVAFCPAEPNNQRHLIEKFGPMAILGNTFEPGIPVPSLVTVRPWGTFEILSENSSVAPYWKLKKIIVNANQSLSLQSHKHRTEFWYASKGSGKLLNGYKDTHWSVTPRDFKADDLGSGMTIIPPECLHRLTAGSEGCEFLEFAFSNTHPIDENDITRYEDQYGRV